MPDIKNKKDLGRFLSDHYFTKKNGIPLNYGDSDKVIDGIVSFLEDAAYNGWVVDVSGVFQLKRTVFEGGEKEVPVKGEKGVTEIKVVKPSVRLALSLPNQIREAATQGLRDRLKENTEE